MILYTEISPFESGNIKQSFSGSISGRGTLDQKLQSGNKNTAKKKNKKSAKTEI